MGEPCVGDNLDCNSLALPESSHDVSTTEAQTSSEASADLAKTSGTSPSLASNQPGDLNPAELSGSSPPSSYQGFFVPDSRPDNFVLQNRSLPQLQHYQIFPTSSQTESSQVPRPSVLCDLTHDSLVDEVFPNGHWHDANIDSFCTELVSDTGDTEGYAEERCGELSWWQEQGGVEEAALRAYLNSEGIDPSRALYQSFTVFTLGLWASWGYSFNRTEYLRYRLDGKYNDVLSANSRARAQARLVGRAYTIPGQLPSSSVKMTPAQISSWQRQASAIYGFANFISPFLYSVNIYRNNQSLKENRNEPDSEANAAFQHVLAAENVGYTGYIVGSSSQLLAERSFVPPGLASSLGVLSRTALVAGNAIVAYSAVRQFYHQFLVYKETGEYDHGVISKAIKDLALCLSYFVRSLQALDDIWKHLKNSGLTAIEKQQLILEASGGKITSQKLMWMRHVARAISAAGLVLNIGLLVDAWQKGDPAKIASALLGVASGTLFLMGIPMLAAGPAAPTGGLLITGAYALTALQMAVDNHKYIQHLFAKATLAGEEGLADFRTALSPYKNVLADAKLPLHLLNQKRQREDLPTLTEEALLAGLEVYGVNERDPQKGVGVALDQRTDFKILAAFSKLSKQCIEQNHKYAGDVPESEKRLLLLEIYKIWQSFAYSFKAQAAFLVLMGPLVLENKKFINAMKNSESGRRLQSEMTSDRYYIEFRGVFYNSPDEYFEFIKKQKIRDEIAEDLALAAHSAVDTSFTRPAMLMDYQSRSHGALAWFNREQRRSGLPTYNYHQILSLAESELEASGVYEPYGQQNRLSVKVIDEFAQISRAVNAERQNPNQSAREEILAEIYNTQQKLKYTPEALTVYMLLLETTVFRNSDYIETLSHMSIRRNLYLELQSESLAELKFKWNGRGMPAFNPNDPLLSPYQNQKLKPISYDPILAQNFSLTDADFQSLDDAMAFDPDALAKTIDQGIESLEVDPDILYNEPRPQSSIDYDALLKQLEFLQQV